MGVPKHRTSKARRDRRRGPDRLKPTQTVKCPDCGADKLPHRVCPECEESKKKKPKSKTKA